MMTSESATANVNFELLDEIVHEYLLFEGFSLPPKGKIPIDIANITVNRIQALRQLILEGKLHEALEIIPSICPIFSQSHPDLVFRTQLQQFIELVRVSRIDDARRLCCQLAPAALLTHTAYEEFSRALLLFLFPESDIKSPVKDLWSKARLESLADDVCDSLSRTLALKWPRLHIVLAYLITIHNAYHFTQGKKSPIEEVDNWLIPPASPLPTSDLTERFTSEQISSVPQTDIHLLSQTVGISRDAAIRSILENDGFVNAVHDELSQMKFNKKLLIPLLLDYVSTVTKLTSSRVTIPLNARAEALRSAGARSSGTVPSAFLCDVYSALCDHAGYDFQSLISTIRERAPHLLKNEAPLMVRLHLLEMSRLQATGDRDGALRVLREKLAGLCLRYDLLRPLLRDAAAVLVVPQVTKASRLSLASLARTIVEKLALSQQAPEPRFVTTLKYLLQTHSLYFERVRMCDDRLVIESFDKQLAALSLLKQTDVLGVCATIPEEQVPQAAQTQVSEEMKEDTSAAHEVKISTVMELLAVGRDQAARLLEQFDGNLENVLASAFDEASHQDS